jgi:hypothetical protein
MAEPPAYTGDGITLVPTTSVEVGSAAYLEKRAAAADPDAWKTYFPSVDWLREQLTKARTDEPERLFLPWKDFGWFCDRMLANRELLGAAVEAGKIIDAILYANELGILTTEARMKFNEFEPGRSVEQLALAGQRSRGGASAGGKGRGSSDKIMDRRAPLVSTYRRKRNEGWEHVGAARFAISHTDYGKAKPLGPKQAARILRDLK